jgi:hypothetical protein
LLSNSIRFDRLRASSIYSLMDYLLSCFIQLTTKSIVFHFVLNRSILLNILLVIVRFSSMYVYMLYTQLVIAVVVVVIIVLAVSFYCS